MAKSKQNNTEEAIAQLRDFYANGQESLLRYPGRATNDDLKDEAKNLGLNPFVLRKARQFADPEAGFSRSDLQKLCAQVRQQKIAKRGQPPFGRSHLIRLLAIPKPERASWQRKAVVQGWTVNRMRTEMAKHFGRRRVGGKRPIVPKDLPGVYAQIESMCQHWRRWSSDLSARSDRSRASIAMMPKDIQESLKEAKNLLTKLQADVSHELKSKWPKREMKHSDLADISPERK